MTFYLEETFFRLFLDEMRSHINVWHSIIPLLLTFLIVLPKKDLAKFTSSLCILKYVFDFEKWKFKSYKTKSQLSLSSVMYIFRINVLTLTFIMLHII